jgi:hypothetical protein
MKNKKLLVVRALGRIARGALILFGISLVVLIAILKFMRHDDPVAPLIGIPSVAVIFISGLAHIASLFARHSIASGYLNWQFSVLTLLVAMTLVAVLLGLMVYAASR